MRKHYYPVFSYVQALIETHDNVASKNYEVVPPEAYPLITGDSIIPQSFPSVSYSAQNLTQDAIRMVGIRKNPDESLVLFSVSFSFRFLVSLWD